MRTPLNGIIGMTDIVINENKDEELDKSLKLIKASGEFLLSLINDVLDISKIESGNMVLDERPVMLEEFDNIIQSVIVPLIEKKHIEFVYEMKCGMECALIDLVRFNQIFLNLLSNAVKFTDEGGKIEFTAQCISSEKEYEWVRFCVRDNGIGMTEEFIPQAFVPFVQDQKNVIKQQNQGTGLGLSISKELVELMNGKISLKSELGIGTEFIIDLPLKYAQPQKIISENMKLSSDFSGKHILLVEDNNVNTVVAIKLLEAKGIIVKTAVNGSIAVKIMQEAKPEEFDAILMDIRMPVMDGIEATKIIRKLDKKNIDKIPIIAMTANAFDDDIKVCINAGMNAHLSKPINPKKLYETLERYISK